MSHPCSEITNKTLSEKAALLNYPSLKEMSEEDKVKEFIVGDDGGGGDGEDGTVYSQFIKYIERHIAEDEGA